MSRETDIATKVKFIDICRMLEKIQKAQGSRQKEAVLQRYIDSFNTFSKEFKEKNGENVCQFSFYPVLRCLIPGADTARSSYGIQLTTMGKLYIKILNLSPQGDDAQKLNYSTAVQGCRDYADVVYSVMLTRSKETYSSLSMADIHDLLNVMAENNRRKTEMELTKFINTASALEQKWLIRIILKKLHIGLGEQKILSLYHPLAKEFYARVTDLKKVCESVDSGETIDITDVIRPNQFVRPMLCEQLDLSKVETMFKQNIFYLETKMDGERFQIHIDDERYKYISRNGKDFTSTFGESSAEGNLTPLLCKLFKQNIQNIILDGEMMVWDKEMLSYRVKGENFDVKSLHHGGNLRPCFVAYDMLYLNGVNYADKPYIARVGLLEKIIKKQPGILMICKKMQIKNSDELIKLFNEALDANEEGVVIKKQNSAYKPGTRNGGWYKIKPDYISGIISEFDLLIIGGFYNRTRTYIDSYLLGIYKKNDDNEDPPLFYSFAKVGLGLSYPQRKHLNESLKKHWQTNLIISKKSGNANNGYIEWGSCIPDIWIEPKNSVILQIRATELSSSSSFRTSCTLRFPRIVAIRNDKLWNDCMTLEELETFQKRGSGVEKLTKRALSSKDLIPSAKRIKLESTKKKVSNNNPYAEVFKADEISRVSDACEGLQFCILSTTDNKPSIIELKEMAVKHGGKIVENPTLDTKKCICIAGNVTGRVKRLIETGLYNIVSVDWMVRSFNDDNSNHSAQPKPRDMISMTKDMKEEFKKYFDQYGDSYTDPIDIDELQVIVHDLHVEELPKLLDAELLSLERTLYEDVIFKNIFRSIFGYFYSASDCLTNIMIIGKLIFQSKAGYCIDSQQLKDNRRMSYIFIDNASIDLDILKDWIYKNVTTHFSKVKVLSYNWIFDCDSENKMLDLSNYLIKLT